MYAWVLQNKTNNTIYYNLNSKIGKKHMLSHRNLCKCNNPLVVLTSYKKLGRITLHHKDQSASTKRESFSCWRFRVLERQYSHFF